MDNREDESVLAFDTLFTTNHIQIMKVLLPYFEEDLQKHLAVYIKFMELEYTMNYFKKHPMSFSSCSFEKKELNIEELYSRVKGYLTTSERQKAEQLVQTMQMMHSFQDMKEMMDMMQMMQGGDNENDGNADPMDLIKNMLTPEQQMMFEMFKENG